jgi:DNA-binding NarL/FixJ family response regulator
MIRLLIVDDQRLFCEGFKTILDAQSDFQVVGVAGNGKVAIELVESLQPDMVLMDLDMPIMDGRAATRVICERFPNVKVLVLTTFDDDEYLKDSIDAGAIGYLLKADMLPEQLAQTIHLANEGVGQTAPNLLRRLVKNQSNSQSSRSKESFRSLVGVSEKERKVLQLVVEGLSNREIGERLFIADGTVKTHVKHLFEKLGCKNRVQLVNTAYAAVSSEQNR